MRIFVLRKKCGRVGVPDPGCRNVLGSEQSGSSADDASCPFIASSQRRGEEHIHLPLMRRGARMTRIGLIEILGKYNVKATFFLVGQWVDTYRRSGSWQKRDMR